MNKAAAKIEDLQKEIQCWKARLDDPLFTFLYGWHEAEAMIENLQAKIADKLDTAQEVEAAQ